MSDPALPRGGKWVRVSVPIETMRGEDYLDGMGMKILDTAKDRAIAEENAQLKAKVADLNAYADKLAAGLPMLPKDIEFLRDSNAKLAQSLSNERGIAMRWRALHEKALRKQEDAEREVIRLQTILCKGAKGPIYNPAKYAQCGCGFYTLHEHEYCDSCGERLPANNASPSAGRLT